MRFLRSLALEKEAKLRLAASCSAADAMSVYFPSRRKGRCCLPEGGAGIARSISGHSCLSFGRLGFRLRRLLDCAAQLLDCFACRLGITGDLVLGRASCMERVCALF